MPVAPIPATGVVTIDLGQIAENWQSLARLVDGRACGAVVKADAYGLGAVRVIPALATAGCTTFFIATPDEAENARARAPNATIYALDGLLPYAGQEFARLGVIPVLSNLADVEAWVAFGKARGGPLPAALHIDSGLNRLGLPARDVRKLASNEEFARGPRCETGDEPPRLRR